MANANNGFKLGRRDDTPSRTCKVVHRQLNFPDADSAVTSVLLEYAGFPVCQARRQFLKHLFHTGIEMCVTPPSDITRSISDILCPQLQDDVGMCADKNPCGCHLTNHGIENRPVASVLNRIDPYEHTV